MDDKAQLEQAIAALEAQRTLLGDAVVEMATAPLREKIAALAAPAPAPPAVAQDQQRKLATILFADVSGFTAMSETMDAEDVAATFNALWVRLDAAITSHGGHIDKHMGDAVMAIFGTPVGREDDPERAVKAALLMQAELTRFAERQAKSATVLRMRIGVNTGHMVLGTVGTTGEFTAMGDAVNLASRLEHAAPVGGILISHDTYRHARGVFEVEPQEPIMVKGKRDPVRVYVVTGSKPHSFRMATRGVEGVETPTVGRDAEFALLREALERAEVTRKPQMVTLLSEAGMGKSRLLYELHNWIELRPKRTRLFKGRALQQNRNAAFSLMRDILSWRFNILEADSAREVRRKMEQGFAEFLGEEGEAKAHVVGHLVGFDFSDSPLLEGLMADPRQLREVGTHYAAQFLTASVNEDSGLVLLEDAHWADEPSLELLEAIVAAVGNCPLAVVAAVRPGFSKRRIAWPDPAHNTRIALARLATEETASLVKAILRKAPLVPDRLVELIVLRAEGNAFFVEELIKMFIDDGTIIPGEEEWEIAPGGINESGVPETLTGVLQARLDGLPLEERVTLQRAAVVGRRFSEGVVEMLRHLVSGRQLDADSVSAYLSSLANKEIIFRSEDTSATDGREFIFKSAILHDVTYETILRRERRGYHGQVARLIVELHGDRAGEHATQIAEHFELAEERTDAGDWFATSAKQAKDAYAPEQAIRLYMRALDLWATEEASQRPQMLEALGHLGQLFEIQARFEEALGVFQQLLEMAGEQRDDLATARAWTGIATVHSRQGGHAVAVEAAGAAEAAAKLANEPSEQLAAMALKVRSHLNLGQVDVALTIAREMLAIAVAAGIRHGEVRSLNLLGAGHALRGEFGSAEERFAEALAACQRLGDRTQEMDLLNNLGWIAEERGDARGALRRYEEALVTAQDTGNRNMEILLLNNVGAAHLGLGDNAAAEQNLRLSLLMAETAGRADVGDTLSFLAESCLRQGKIQEAEIVARRALASAEAESAAQFIAAAWRTLGTLASHLGRAVAVHDDGDDKSFCEADNCFEQSERVAQGADLEAERLHTLRAWSTHHLQRGNAARGRDLWAAVEALAEQMGVAVGERPGTPQPV